VSALMGKDKKSNAIFELEDLVELKKMAFAV
jgi:hypothetical protein